MAGGPFAYPWSADFRNRKSPRHAHFDNELGSMASAVEHGRLRGLGDVALLCAAPPLLGEVDSPKPLGLGCWCGRGPRRLCLGQLDARPVVASPAFDLRAGCLYLTTAPPGRG